VGEAFVHDLAYPAVLFMFPLRVSYDVTTSPIRIVNTNGFVLGTIFWEAFIAILATAFGRIVIVKTIWTASTEGGARDILRFDLPLLYQVSQL
jgi:hypothetical protein